ncbi:MAG TPA: Calx-beta domain-containing protein [Pyrinomonadaceae bacterium]|nr:Calx-beta domain-containing protein [Pyrinomonadaceae bacterium]
MSLINTGGVITLRDQSQAIVNLVSYGGSTGLNGNADQSLTRSPDVTGGFTLHQSATGASGAAFSPGRRVNGTPFNVCQVVARIEVSPPSATINEGATQQFTAQAFDANNQPIPGVIFFWESSNTAVATIDQNGLATGLSAGTTQIRASGRGVTSNPATLTVNAINRVLTTIEVTPNPATIPVSGTQQFTARALDQFGNEIAGVTFTWDSGDNNIAIVDANGLATGVNQGQTNINARSGGVTGSAVLNVTAPTMVFNEVLADPPGSAAGDLQGDANHDGARSASDDEFVEFVNSTGSAINISGWTLRTQPTGSTTETIRHTFTAGTTIPAGEAIVIFGGGGPTFDPAHPAFACAQVVEASSGGLSLTNGGLTLVLRNGSGGVVSQFSYGTGTGLVGDNDQSLTRSPDVTGGFVQHLAAAGAGARRFSPGTRVNGTPFGSCPSQLTSVTISPPATSVVVGQSTQFTAQAFDQFGQPMLGVTITFTSDNTTVATVDSVSTNPGTGVATATVTGQSVGIAHITAQATDGSTTVNSTPATLTVNATAPTYIVTGNVTDGTSPVAGVLITFEMNFQGNLTSTTTTTDANGNYSSGDLGCQNTVKVTPSKAGLVFTPLAISFVNSSGCLTGTAVANFTASPTPPPVTGNMVISQVYGGGGNTGAPFTHDFIELFNRGTTAADITGWSVQYNSTTSPNAFAITPLCPTGTCIVQPGKYFLVREAATNTVSCGNAPCGVALPTPDATGTINMAATGGRVALVNSLTALPSNASCVQQLGTAIDFVGYGTANCFEGSGPAPAPSATTADLRLLGGCVDTNNNVADFVTGAPNPRNSASPVNDCSAADLSITKTDSPDPVVTGSNITYTITVTNNGPATAQSVVVTDNLPAEVTFVSCASTGSGVCGGSGNNRTVSYASLANGASETITLVATANSAAGTTITNTATVASSSPDPNSGNDSSTATTNVQAATPLPTLSIDNISMSEGNAGTTTFTFTVSLSSPAGSGGVTFDIATADGLSNPATAGSDYVAKTEIGRSIAPGDSSATFTVTVNGDTDVEPDETFFVNVTNVTGATVTDGEGLGTIQNDDAAFAEDDVVINEFVVNPTAGKEYVELLVTKPGGVDMRGWTMSDVNTRAGSTSGTEGDITLPSAAYLSNVPQGTFVVIIGAAPAANSNSLTEDTDTTDGNRRLVLISGSTTGLVTAGTFDVSGDENIQLYAPGGRAAGRLVDQVLAGGSTAYIFAPDGTTIQANWGDNSTATTSDNINGSSAVPGNSNIAFCPTSDTLAEFQNNDTGARFTRTAASYGTPGARNTCVASDTSVGGSGAIPTISISDATPVTEGASATTTTATFTVTLSAASTDTVTVQYATQDVTATAGSDYVAIPLTTLTFNPTETSKTIDVTVNGDSLDEIDETFNVNLSNPSNATILDGQGVGTITDDDDAPTISINDPAAVTEGVGATTTTITFDVTLSAPSGKTITVNYATANGTAVAGATAGTGDYDSTNGTLTFNPGVTSQSVIVTVNGDDIDEPDTESFNVVLTLPNNATLLDDTGVGTITDDDPVPSLAINDPAAVSEGNAGTKTITFTVTLTGATERTVTVDFATQDSTATTADSDYVATNGTLTFSPGTTTQDINVTINGGATIEPDETFFVNLTLPVGSPATISDSQGVGTIANDDAATPTFSIESKSVNEGTGSDTVVNYTVTLNPTSTGTVTVDYTIASGSATVGLTGASNVDATAASLTGTLTFGSGVATQDIPVTIIGDSIDEADESFTITLSNPSSGTAISGTQGVGTETITDDEATPTVTIGDAVVTEGNSGTTTANFNVTLTGTSSQTITITYSTADGPAGVTGAVAGSDYVAVAGGSVIYNPGETGVKQIQITVNGDKRVELSETFDVNLTGATNASITDGLGQGTITNDDVILINEIDSDTPSTDVLEFVELYDGGVGNTPLDGLVIILYNGSNDRAYAAFDLDGMTTDANGYFVLGNIGLANEDMVLPNGTLQNGPDAVAIYIGNGADFITSGASATLVKVDNTLIDAIVYDVSASAPDTGLTPLLLSGSQVNEGAGAGGSSVNSLQRCPNGSGGARSTTSYISAAPSHDATNTCPP